MEVSQLQPMLDPAASEKKDSLRPKNLRRKKDSDSTDATSWGLTVGSPEEHQQGRHDGEPQAPSIPPPVRSSVGILTPPAMSVTAPST